VVSLWALGLCALVAGVAAGLSRSADRLITQHAEHTALAYARHIAEHVLGLKPLLLTGQADATTLQQLRSLRRLGDVFRFKLFDRSGALLLVSDELDGPGPLQLPPRRDAVLGQHHSAHATVRDIVLGGSPFVELLSGAGQSGRPAHYTEAYVPVRVDGALVGVVEVYVDSTEQVWRTRAAFGEVTLTVLAALALVAAALALQGWQRRREAQLAESRVRYLAEHDVLSGALNRASFQQTLEQAARRHQQGGPGFAVLCVDLDRFKEVNDAHGHAGGDAVLRETTQRLQRLVRHGDVLARLGGDEFAVLQTEVKDIEAVRSMGERVVDALSRPYEFAGRRLLCGASVGAARFGVDAHGVEDLLHKADVAMYRAKSHGRGRFSFYDPELDRALEERRALAQDLRVALAEGHLALHYQPLHEADAGQGAAVARAGDPTTQLLGYEALMRWQHPTRGAVSPSVFIPLAEETGLIEALGCWALERACHDAASWPAPLSVSVNLSAAQFRGERDLVEVVQQALAQSRLPAQRLSLEITESLLMGNTEAVVHTLTKLSALGVSIVMDDFGTGYSSLAYLWRFPFDKVKIDRAFTRDLGRDRKVALIVRSIVSLAHSLGIRVNAEGVETLPQAELLRTMGCDELQGYLLGRPQAVADLEHHGAGAAKTFAPTAPAELDAPPSAAPAAANDANPRAFAPTAPAPLEPTFPEWLPTRPMPP